MRRRIVLVTPSIYPASLTDVAVNSILEANFLASRGYEVILATGSSRTPIPERIKLLRFPSLQFRFLSTLTEKRNGAVKQFARVADSIVRYNPALVHVHSSVHGMVGALVKRRLGCPLIVTVYPHDFERFGRIKLLRSLQKIGVHNSDSCVCHNRALQTLVLRKHRISRSRISILPVGVYIPNGSAKGTLTRRPINVGYYGPLEKQCGMESLVSMTRAVAASDREVSFLIAGIGSWLRKISSSVRKYGLGRAVHVKRSVSETDRKRLYSATRLFVFPAIWDAPITWMLHAMVRSKPIIATDVLGSAGIFRNGVNAVVLKNPNTERLSVAVRTLLSNPHEMESLGGHARATVVRNHNLEKIQDQLFELIQSLT